MTDSTATTYALDEAAALTDALRRLEAQERTIKALMDRFDRSSATGNAAYTIFEQNTLLQQTIVRRTRELEQANRLLQQEVVERTLAEAALRSSEHRYRLLFDQSPYPMWVFDVETLAFLNVNQAAVDHYGFTRDEFRRMTLLDIRPSEDVERFLDQHRDHGVADRQMWRHQLKDGRVITVEITSHRLELDGRKVEIVLANDITDRLEAEAALRESQSYLEEAQRVGGIGHWALDLRTGESTWAPQTFRMFGCDPERDTPSFELYLNALHPDDRVIAQDASRGTFEEGLRHEYDARFILPDGELRWVHASGHMICDEAGKPIRMQGLCQDITARKRHEQELSESLSILKATLEATTDAVLVVDAQGRFEGYNGKFRELWGLAEGFADSPDQGFSQALAQIKEPEHFQSRLAEILADPEARSFDELRFRDGRIIERYSQPAEIGGVFSGRVWSFRDVTEARRAEESLRYRLELEECISQVSAVLLMAGAASLEERINAALERVGQVMRMQRSYIFLADDPNLESLSNTHEWVAEGVGSQLQELQGVRPEDFPTIEASLRAGRPIIISSPDELPEGTAERELMEVQGVLSYAIVPLLRGGKLEGLLGIDSMDPAHPCSRADIAALQVIGELIVGAIERQRAEENRSKLELQLRQSQKMEAIGTLAGGIAHDFNNILNAIIGYAELVMDNLPEGSLERADQGEVITAARRAADLVKRILAFSRQGQGQLERVPLASLCKEVSRLLRASLPATIRIEPAIEAADATVRANPTEIHQVLMNLCTNAGQAMPDGGTLSLRLQAARLDEADVLGHGCKPGQYNILRVSDTGCGIPPEVLDRIYEPFFTTKEAGKGTGLGLSTVHGIVKSLGGFISVESAVGKGTTFSVALPAAESGAAAQTVDTAATARPRGSARIMFVDDEAMLVRMNQQALSRLGYTVLAFSSSTEALAAFEADPDGIDLLVTDQTMPELTGANLARQVLARRPGLPIVLCTGYSATLTEEMATSMGISAYLRKPVHGSELALAIARLLAPAEDAPVPALELCA